MLKFNVITSDLSEALGHEISITDNVIDKYQELQQEMDNLILKKKGETILNASEEKYNNALTNRDQLTQELIDKQEELNKAKEKEKELYDEYVEAITNADSLTDNFTAEKNWKNQQEAVASLEREVSNLQDSVNDYTADIEDYQYKYELWTEGTPESIQQMVDEVGKSYEKNGETIELNLARQIQAQQHYLNNAKRLNEEAVKNNDETEKKKTQTTIDESEKRLDALIDELIAQTSIVDENSEDVKNAWKSVATGSYDTYEEEIKKLPIEMQQVIQQMTGVIITETPKVTDSTDGLADAIIKSLDKNAEIKQLAIDELESYLTGLSDEQQRSLLLAAGINNVEEVMKGLKEGDLSEEAGIEILKGLGTGLDNQYWKNQIFERANALFNNVFKTLHLVTGTSTKAGMASVGISAIPRT